MANFLPAGIRFDDTLGVLLIGGFVSSALWGVTTVQTYLYYNGNSRDHPLLISLVAILWILDTFDSCLTGHMLYHYVVTNFMNPFAIAIPVWSVVIHVSVTSVIDFSVRTMFARRVYFISNKNIILIVILMALSLLDLTCGILITVKAFQVATFIELDKISNLMYLNFASGMASDTAVASAVVWYLRKSRTGFKRTDSLVNILMMYTVNTGLLVAIDASLGMFCYIAMPKNFVFIAFYFLLPKLYVNSYLASLNARESLRERGTEFVSINLSKLGNTRRYDTEMGSVPTATEKTPAGMAITVETVVKTDRHSEYLEY